jgi:succinate dehydrogenase/fumarate reductase cytochrome b subunit
VAVGLLFFLVFVVFGLGGLALFVWALIDAVQVPDDSMYRSGTKLVWVLVIVLVPIIGAIVYLAVGRPVSRV